MTRAVSRPTVTQACLDAISEAEARHVLWSGGVTMRAAPESLVQAIVAESLGSAGVRLLLEVSLKDLRAIAQGVVLSSESDSKNGRVDLAVYYKSKMPRFVIEIKKVQSKTALLSDCRRIHDLLRDCPSIQNGLMIGYTVAARLNTVNDRLNGIVQITGSRIVRLLKPLPVINKRSAPRFLGAAVYRVDRTQPKP